MVAFVVAHLGRDWNLGSVEIGFLLSGSIIGTALGAAMPASHRLPENRDSLSVASTPPAPATRNLGHALFLSTFAALHDPISRAYYDKKRDEKKNTTRL